jgi:hypothetical protein
MTDNDFIDVQPWPLSELVGTLVTRVAIARRGLIEDDAESDVFERETDRFELDAWARLELSSWLLAGDSEILDAPIGNLDEDQAETCHDALIQASSVAWALHVIPTPELPVFTDGEPERIALGWAPGPWTPVRTVLKAIRIRSDNVLARERERWELLYWRLMLPDPLDPDARAALAETTREIAEIGLLSLGDGDFATDGGVRFGELSAESLANHAREAEIRLRSLNWVCGLGNRIDSAPLIDGDEDQEP